MPNLAKLIATKLFLKKIVQDIEFCVWKWEAIWGVVEGYNCHKAKL